jgi:hypothetical protein
MSELKPEPHELQDALRKLRDVQLGSAQHTASMGRINVWQLVQSMEATSAEKQAAVAALSNARIMFWSTVFAAVSAGASAVSAFFPWWK